MFSQTDMFGAPPFWNNGPAPGCQYLFPNQAPLKTNPATEPIVHTRSPATCGSSVLGLKFKDGVILAADVAGYYGSLLRYRNIDRVLVANENIVVGASGDIADFQYMKDIIKEKIVEENCLEDCFKLRPKALHTWLTRILYNRRSKMDPLWNEYVVAGIEGDDYYIGFIDKIGCAFNDDLVTTGFGTHLSLPMMREALDRVGGYKNLTREQAIETLHSCMSVLYYRDARSFFNFDLVVITKDGVDKQRVNVKEHWEFARVIKESI